MEKSKQQVASNTALLSVLGVLMCKGKAKITSCQKHGRTKRTKPKCQVPKNTVVLGLLSQNNKFAKNTAVLSVLGVLI